MLTNENVFNPQSVDIPLLYKELSIITDRIGKNEGIEKGLFSSSTYYKWKNSYNPTGPKPSTAEKVLKHDSGKNTMPEIAEYYGGQIKNWISATYDLSLMKEENNHYSKPTKNEVDAYIINLCGADHGIEESDLLSNLANLLCCINEETLEPEIEEILSYVPVAKNKLKKLLNNETLLLNNDTYKLNTDTVFFDLEDLHINTKKFEPYIIKEELRHLNLTHSRSYSEKVPLDCVKRCNIRQLKAHKENIEDMTKNASKDGVHFYVSTTAEFMEFPNFHPETKGVH